MWFCGARSSPMTGSRGRQERAGHGVAASQSRGRIGFVDHAAIGARLTARASSPGALHVGSPAERGGGCIEDSRGRVRACRGGDCRVPLVWW